MGSSGFENWTQEKVEAHNARIAQGIRACAKVFDPPKPIIPMIRPIVVQKQESTDIQKLNKLERSFYNLLLLVSNHQQIWVQAIQLKLADDCRYLPDFVVLTKDGQLIAYETKGHRWAKNMIKLRMAARTFPIFKFILVSRKNGQWIYEDMKP